MSNEALVLTASNSAGVKMYFSSILYGTIATTKNGKAKAIGDDLITHSKANPRNWSVVKRCILRVFTYKKNLNLLCDCKA